MSILKIAILGCGVAAISLRVDLDSIAAHNNNTASEEGKIRIDSDPIPGSLSSKSQLNYKTHPKQQQQAL